MVGTRPRETETPIAAAAAPSGGGVDRDAFLSVLRDFLRDLRPREGPPAEIGPASRLERDLGIDSLSRAELGLRIERAFRLRLPASALHDADTVADLLQALRRARPRGGLSRGPVAKPPAPSPIPTATEAGTLTAMLDWHAAHHGDRLHVTVLEDDETVAAALTYGELRQRARTAAAGLVSRGIEPGDRVALMLPTGADFFVGFFAILYAGATPVPIYPPGRPSQLEEHMNRQAGILQNAGARILVTVPEGRRLASLLRPRVDALAGIETVADLAAAGAAASPLPPAPKPEATALIQYTSGSTGDPKGVVLTHANLNANVRAMGQALEAGATDVFVSWLPLYHDMGLIGAWLGSLLHAAPFYVMPPTSFLARPEDWLRAIHRHRGTLTASPNFGFELCLNKIDPDGLEGLDLSSLRVVANGAEPVSPDTLRRFTERFGRFGFRLSAMAPVYGLAECSVGLAFPPLGRVPPIDRLDRPALSQRGVAEPAAPGDRTPLELVACGQALPGHEIRIVDDRDRELPDRREGRLQFRGPSATAGYFGNEEKTHELIRDGWHESGDRAYVADGDVYITGRIKDLIIRGGHNFYPQELEEAVAGIAGVRKGGVAVFGSPDRSSGTERLVVLAETRETDEAARSALQARIRDVADDILGLPPEIVLLVPPRTVPKTSSGKVRRSAARMLYEQGRIATRPASVRWQIARLWLEGAAAAARRRGRTALEWLYAAWWWTVVGACYLVAFSAALVLPRLEWRWAVAHAVARAGVACWGVPASVTGAERIPRRDAVLVFNHASYIDAFLIATVTPGEPVFVAKKELARQFFAGLFLRRLGTAFVERYDVGDSIADMKALARRTRAGELVIFFPEGSLTRRPGLSEFYLGAFRIAAKAGVPVVPGALRGTRAMLRGDQWFPRRVALSVTIGEPIKARGNDFAAVRDLRDAARAAILAMSGEPDLRELVKPDASKAERPVAGL